MNNPTDDFVLGLHLGGWTYVQIAEYTGKTKGYVSGRISRLRGRLKEAGKEYPVEGDYPTTVEIKDDGTQISDRLIKILEEDSKNPKRLLELHGYDPNAWVVVNSISNPWHMMKGWRMGGGVELLYQSKLTVKPNTELTLDIVRQWFENYDHKIRHKPAKQNQYSNKGDVLEINLADLHKGKRTPYERKSLSENIKYTVNDIVSRAKGKKFSKIYFILNGDTFHFDGKNRRTTKGTPMETDGATPMEIFDDVAYMLIWIIDSLAEIAPVEVIVIQGNHDWFVSYTLAMFLYAIYKDVKGVHVDTEHKPRKWRVIGCTLTGWMHGDMSKTNATGWLMVEAREAWGKTRFAEVHAAHWHSQSIIEKNGALLRYLPSMTGIDEYHYEKGFVGAVKSTICFVYGMDEGIKEIWQTNVL